jgi:hypothetical protein
MASPRKTPLVREQYTLLTQRSSPHTDRVRLCVLPELSDVILSSEIDTDAHSDPCRSTGDTWMLLANSDELCALMNAEPSYWSHLSPMYEESDEKEEEGGGGGERHATFFVPCNSDIRMCVVCSARNKL